MSQNDQFVKYIVRNLGPVPHKKKRKKEAEGNMQCCFSKLFQRKEGKRKGGITRLISKK